jgi:hypothetical protein
MPRPAGGVQLGEDGAAVERERKAMHQVKRHRGEGSARSATRASLSPYFIEDIGLTASELSDARRTEVRVVTPR